MSGDLAYAQARMQSRHGARPGPHAWAKLHASITLATLVEGLRACGLDAWVAGLDPACPQDELEMFLRERLRARIGEVGRWMPEAWEAAFARVRGLVDLPARQHLERGGAPLAWMARDPPLAGEARLEADPGRASRARRRWIDAWRASWPPCPEGEAAGLEELVAAIEAHLQVFARAPPDEAGTLRLDLERRLTALFRRHALAPAAAFAHLALVALDLERVRAELVARRPPRGGAA